MQNAFGGGALDTFLLSESAMVILFIILGAGFAARKLGWMNDEFDRALTRLVINITCPCMILNSVLSNTEPASNATILYIVGFAFLVHVPILLIAFVVPKFYPIPALSKGSHRFAIAFGNTGFIGFAVVDCIMGSNYVLYAAMFNIPYNIFLFSLGPLMMSSADWGDMPIKQRILRVLKNLTSPALIACIVALVLQLLHVTDSGIIGTSIKMIGDMTPVAAMLIIGSTIASMSIRAMFKDPWSYISSLFRLIVVPLAAFGVGLLMGLDPKALAAIVLVIATPVASMGVMFALNFGGDVKPVTRITFLTTLFSFFTIPLLSILVL